jgi:hypothetical protein
LTYDPEVPLIETVLVLPFSWKIVMPAYGPELGGDSWTSSLPLIVKLASPSRKRSCQRDENRSVEGQDGCPLCGTELTPLGKRSGAGWL